MRELYISFGPKWAPNKWFGTLFMKFELWERWISITGGAGTAFPCVQWHFNHWEYNAFAQNLAGNFSKTDTNHVLLTVSDPQCGVLTLTDPCTTEKKEGCDLGSFVRGGSRSVSFKTCNVFVRIIAYYFNKKLSYRREAVQCLVLLSIFVSR